ncbi:MAG: hypothetical protein CL609_10860 [Anaerolineaceae bacterium]|nr:hypothetical protein [Anaerolineaceae bacterium]
MNKQDIISYIKEVHFGYLATVDEKYQPRVRPIAIHNVYNDHLYFFTFGHTRKVQELKNNPYVEIVWSNLSELSQVRIGGTVTLETSKKIKNQFKEDNPMVTQMLTPEIKHLFQLYKFQPEKVEVAVGLVPYEETDW